MQYTFIAVLYLEKSLELNTEEAVSKKHLRITPVSREDGKV
ncbi:MAG: hypothetical protein ACXWV2_03295 [Chitinophagaceae bacterium]